LPRSGGYAQGDREILSNLLQRVLAAVGQPKRSRSTFSSRGVSVLSTLFVCSRSERPMMESTGDTTCLSSMSRRVAVFLFPIGVSSEMGSCAIFRLSGPCRPALPSWWRSLPASALGQLLDELARGPDELVDRLDHVHRDADGARLVGDGARDGLADPPRRVRRELVPRRYSNLSTAFMRPMLPSWIRSRNCRPRFVYFLAIEMTSRRLASTISFLAMAACAGLA